MRDSDRESDPAIVDLQRREQREVLVDDVCRVSRVGRIGVEGPSQLFAQMFPGKSDRSVAADTACEHRRLQEPLEIDDRVVIHLAKLAHRLAKPLAPFAPFDRARIDRDAAIDARDEIEQFDVTRIDHPVHPTAWKLALQRGRYWNAMDDIPKRPEADDQKAVHVDERAIRDRRSRVE